MLLLFRGYGSINYMKSLIETSIKAYFKLRQYRVQSWKRNQVTTQEIIFTELLRSAENTEYGRKYGFDRIVDYAGFQRDVPIVSYDDLQPYISRMLNGERDVLWPGFVPYFSKSSGTTSDVSKYIPVSKPALQRNNYKAGKDLYSIFFANYPESDLFRNSGSVFGLGGSFEYNPSGIKVGDVSAIIMSEVPRWAERHREPSLDVALMPHWKDKIPAMIKDTQSKNITHLSGVPTWFISLFDEMKKNHDYSTLRDIWPNLELFIHGAVAFAPYRPLFEKLLPFSDMKYMEVYNASEGFFAIQDMPDKIGEMLLLTDHGVFYEFIPMSVYGTSDQYTIPLSGVEVDVDYAMVITTNAGLWRYDIGDTVSFTSIDPYRIRISGRTKHFINVFGEELMVGNTEEALTHVCAKTGATIENYTAGPIFMDETGSGGHEWVVEFKQLPADIDTFIDLLDLELCSVNSDYAAKRQDDIALQKLKLHVAPPGTFMDWMGQRGRLGGQNKVPRLSNSRKYIDQIIDMIN